MFKLHFAVPNRLYPSCGTRYVERFGVPGLLPWQLNDVKTDRKIIDFGR